ncbi:PASTA domain-containing protein [Micromonospora sp. STR1_7]|uniref:PASTA domain-containing protein n=1 Tax=Micromonospora parastrephiae TaxID=2806101 RepID=A0ABS1Y2G6_9ACTN|nr:PASTA domain-containing protein [Micromonospora parastrephiae]MBM0235699.1 PASTA domain-containing protein [Micromonospora parastrephiae]
MSDDRQEPPAGERDDDRTRPLPSADRPEPKPPAAPGETAPMNRPATPDETAPIDRTVSQGGPEATAPSDQTMPIDRSALGQPVDPTARMPVERLNPAPWSGRAEVRPPRPAEPAGDWYAEEQGGRRWWLPILWGVLALVLAGLLGAALWVVLSARDNDRDDPGSTPSPPPGSATSAAPTSAAPTSATPSSATPSSPPPSSEPAEVPVPPVAGLPQATAEGLLERLGLPYRVVYRPSELPPGTVVGTEPGAGTTVSDGEDVLLIVSQARPTTGSVPTTSSPTATSTP